MKEYKAKGYINFAYSPDGLIYQEMTRDFLLEERTKYYDPEDTIVKVIEEDIDDHLTFPVYSLMSGKKFLKDVKAGCFIDYDGTLSDIFVNGFKSNIGLACEGIMQGEFLLNGDAFEDFCNNYDVQVNWANK